MAVIYCQECAKQISTLFTACPNCGTKLPVLTPPAPAAPVKIAPAKKERSINLTAVFSWVGAIASIAFAATLICWRAMSGPAAVGGGTSQAAEHADDAARFITRFGRPDRDESNQYASPRPLIVTRSMSYDGEWVRAVFIPIADHGAPPPYQAWKLMVIQDMRDNGALSNDQVAERLSGRLAKR